MVTSKRYVSLLLALILTLSMLSSFVLPASAVEDNVPRIWREAGLVPAQGEDYLELTDDEDLKNGVIFLAPDWSVYALKANEDGSNSGEKLGRLPEINEIFYATMPTTGITYKLKYAVTAGNFNNTNPAVFGTIVMFPGTYTGKTQYLGTSKSKYANFANEDYGYYDGAAATGTFGVAMQGSMSKITSSIPHVRVLGPYAGVAAGETETGTYVRNTANEAILSGTYIYFMNRAFYNGAITSIDGIAGTKSFALATQ